MVVLRFFSSSAGRSRSSPMAKLGSRSLVTSCRAVVVPRFGGPEVLELRSNVEVPDLKPHDVLVRTRAVSINPLDTRMRSGYGRSIFEPLLPLILGRDISGEVAAIGSSVRSLSVGQEVFGALHPTAVRGTYADYAVLSEDELTSKPPSITHVEASAIPFAALTAWRALNGTARIARGQRLLVIGGGGAVGLSAIQLAVASGCDVSTTCGAQSIDRVLEAGAEQAIDYTAEDVETSLKGRFDAVLDTIGVPETERIGINVLKNGGHYMTLQGETASMADRYGLAVGIPVATAILLKKQIQYRYTHGIGFFLNPRFQYQEGFEYNDHIRSGVTKVIERLAPNVTFAIEAIREIAQFRGKIGRFGDLTAQTAVGIMNPDYWWTYMRADPEGLDEIRRLSEAGKLKIPVDRTFSITQAREAHDAKDKRLVHGKVVLEID